MTREEKIKEAYSKLPKKYDDLNPELNGWSNQGVLYNDIDFNLLDTKKMFDSVYYVRPKSLHGIENNNGWIKIESEEDVPEWGYYEVIERKNGNLSRATLDRDFGKKRSFLNYSHYQKIIEIPLPIY